MGFEYVIDSWFNKLLLIVIFRATTPWVLHLDCLVAQHCSQNYWSFIPLHSSYFSSLSLSPIYYYYRRNMTFMKKYVISWFRTRVCLMGYFSSSYLALCTQDLSTGVLLQKDRMVYVSFFVLCLHPYRFSTCFFSWIHEFESHFIVL